MQLLDIITPVLDILPINPHDMDNYRHPVIAPDDPKDIDTVSITTPDSLACPQDTIADTLQSAFYFLGDSASNAINGNTTLLWTSAVVLVALGLCFCLVRIYRNKQLSEETNRVKYEGRD